MFSCTSCGRPYPEGSYPHTCPYCGGVYDLSTPLIYDPDLVALDDRSLWRYRHTFPLPLEATPVTLGEGGTALLADEIAGRKVYFKLEYLNPTGSFKDRGTTLLVSWLKAHGIREAVEDSSGNAGASFAAYAARAGIRARIFIPEYASGPKRAQIEAYGAEVSKIPGPRSAASEAVLKAADNGAVYASHNYSPVGLAGLATAAYEVVEQLGRAPEAVVLPVGHGSFAVGLHRGFKALAAAGVIQNLPRIVAVQALPCAPLWAAVTGGPQGLQWVTEGQTVAEGIRILRPVRGDAVLSAVNESRGTVLAFDDEAILEGRRQLARRGLFVEPTSAVVWPAFLQIAQHFKGDIVVLLTGSGYKTGN